MSSDIIDDRLLGAIHLRSLRREGMDHDPHEAHEAFQSGTVRALMDGLFDGDLNIGELLEHGDHGIGTIQGLDGELVIIDGEAFVARFDGEVRPVGDEVLTPFAVVAGLGDVPAEPLAGPLDFERLCRVLDERCERADDFAVVRIDGRFSGLRVRSVEGQSPPYPTLAEVARKQTEWELGPSEGSIVGFRFPDLLAGIEVPGYHLHFISAARDAGGHVLALELLEGELRLDEGGELVVELPPGEEIEGVDGDRLAELQEVEGR